MPPACTESWVRYRVEQSSQGGKSTFNWILPKAILDTTVHGKGDSIDIKWGTEPDWYKLGVSEISNMGCVKDTSWVQIEVTGTTISLGKDIEACKNDSFKFTATKGFTTYAWNKDASNNTNTLSGIATENDTIKVLAVNANGCKTSDEAIVFVYKNPDIQISLNGEIRDTFTMCGNIQKTLYASSFGMYFLWNINDLTDDINKDVDQSTANSVILQAIPPTSKLKQQFISVTVTDYVTNNFDGCSTTDSILLMRCVPPSAKTIPAAFTPNDGDKVNNEWDIPELADYPEAVVDVYDRWGRLVYHSENGYKKWDGRSNGTEVPMDNYFYVIRLAPKSAPIVGNVMLIR
jgi:gliding motility-associated-like protein